MKKKILQRGEVLNTVPLYDDCTEEYVLARDIEIGFYMDAHGIHAVFEEKGETFDGTGFSEDDAVSSLAASLTGEYCLLLDEHNIGKLSMYNRTKFDVLSGVVEKKDKGL